MLDVFNDLHNLTSPLYYQVTIINGEQLNLHSWIRGGTKLIQMKVQTCGSLYQVNFLMVWNTFISK